MDYKAFQASGVQDAAPSAGVVIVQYNPTDPVTIQCEDCSELSKRLWEVRQSARTHGAEVRGEAHRSLQDLEQPLKKQLEFPCKVVLTINCHGDDAGAIQVGNCSVHKPYSQSMDASRFWSTVKPWLPQNRAMKLYIVAAQCYGALFADELRSLTSNVPFVKVLGLSYQPTRSRLLTREQQNSANPPFLHLELDEAIRGICQGRV